MNGSLILLFALFAFVPSLISITHAQSALRIRNIQYCELLLAFNANDTVLVYNSMGRNLCPEVLLGPLNATLPTVAALFGADLALLNGPRFWTMDFATPVISTPSFPGQGSWVQNFAGIEMVLQGKLSANASALAAGMETAYKPSKVIRKTNWTWVIGNPAYFIDTPQGDRFIMQSYSRQLITSLTAASLSGLDNLLSLPQGFTFFYLPALEANITVATDSAGVVLTDSFRNTYSSLNPGLYLGNGAPSPSPPPALAARAISPVEYAVAHPYDR
ncbi:hypothetical protein BJ742DRAFT_854728 [Cladochytrium replicatum]|nr:hypothetical protein BJ742DRAFT_854728 [Cladochytrium replicatum]